MIQPDLFTDQSRTRPVSQRSAAAGGMPSLVERLTAACERPRYNFMLLTLIAEASAVTGSAGPLVNVAGEDIAIRDWLSDAMNPVGRREPRRLALVARVRADLAAAKRLPHDPRDVEVAVDREVKARLRKSGRTNVSRAVSELVRAGLLQRYYKGDYVDHPNRGGRRKAVYAVTDDVRRAIAGGLGFALTGP